MKDPKTNMKKLLIKSSLAFPFAGLLVMFVALLTGRTVGILAFASLFLIGLVLSIFSLFFLPIVRHSIKVKAVASGVFVVACLSMAYGRPVYGILSDYIYIRPKIQRMNSLVSEIRQNGRIHSMRKHGAIRELNGISVTLDMSQVDTTEDHNIHSLESVFGNDGVDTVFYKRIEQELIALGFNSFEIDHECVLFWEYERESEPSGFAFCESDFRPEKVRHRMIVRWQMVCKNWFSWQT